MTRHLYREVPPLRPDPNFEAQDIYVLRSGVGWVCHFGYVSGKGSWRGARHFQCHGDAKAARDDPSWHNDADNVRKAAIVRLTLAITGYKEFS